MPCLLIRVNIVLLTDNYFAKIRSLPLSIYYSSKSQCQNAQSSVPKVVIPRPKDTDFRLWDVENLREGCAYLRVNPFVVHYNISYFPLYPPGFSCLKAQLHSVHRRHRCF